jgi:hypothetical protein
MRKLAKSAVLGAVTISALIGAAGAASADTGPLYAQHTASANGSGATSSGVLSTAGSPGYNGQDSTGPSYIRTWQYAGAGYADSDVTRTGFNDQGQAYYVHGLQYAGPNGASSSWTASRS